MALPNKALANSRILKSREKLHTTQKKEKDGRVTLSGRCVSADKVQLSAMTQL
jgi:hypothetical protein